MNPKLKLVNNMTEIIKNTKILKVKPESIHFSPNSIWDGSLPTFSDLDTKNALLEAAKIIKDSDETVAFPTETVYGLGGSSLNDNSVLNIYKAKNRPSDNPLITHISSLDQLNRKILNFDPSSTQYNTNNNNNILDKKLILSNIPSIYHSLIEKLWPGPLTILLPVPKTDNKLSRLTTADQSTFAVRLPSNPVARALIALSDTPIAAPSANASTRPSPTLAQHVYHDLNGKIPLILDGGACKVGVESTVVDGLVNPPMLLRPGGFTYEEIVKLGGTQWENCKVENKKNVTKDEKVRTPGMKYKHYSPSAKVILLIPDEHKTDTVLSNVEMEKINNFKDIFFDEYENENSKQSVKKIAILTTYHLNNITVDKLNTWIKEKNINIEIVLQSLGTDGESIQSNLFASLRKVDEDDHADLIFVEGIHEDNEGLAVMNRLNKAAGNYTLEF